MTVDIQKGSRIFITGGTGFFGKWLLRTIADLNESQGAGCEVTVLSRDPGGFLSNNPQYAALRWLRFIKGDIVDFTFPAEEFTHVIHAATDTSESALRNPIAWFDQIVTGTRRTLDFAVQCGGAKCLLTSSGAVYGPQPAGMSRIPEIYSGAPDVTDIKSVYGQAKRAAEQLCTLYHHQYGLHATVARCFAFVGEYLPLNGHFAIGNFINDALHGDTIKIKGDGSPIRSYLHGEDLAIWLFTILERGKPAYPYNVGSDQAVTIANLAALVGNLISPGKPVIIENARPDYAGRSRYIPDISRAREELGLNVRITLEEAIMRTADSANKLSGFL
jgi:UDP-glucuronate decarboxylase